MFWSRGSITHRSTRRGSGIKPRGRLWKMFHSPYRRWI